MDQMQQAYFEMSMKHSNYRGKVSLIAHSLGTVVTYDILCQQLQGDSRLELGFMIDCYFILGSPLGLFQAVHNSEEDFVRPKPPRVNHFYNLYHPSDLIAYRIEPLIKEAAGDPEPNPVRPPVLVPHYLNSGFNPTQRFL